MLLQDIQLQKIRFVTTMYTDNGVGKLRTNRESWALILKYEGQTVYRCGEKSYLSDLHHPILLPKGSTYTWNCTEAGRYITIDFDCPLTGDELFSFTVSNPEQLLEAMQKLEYSRLQKEPLWNLTVTRDACDLLLKLIRENERSYTPNEQAKKLKPAVDYMLAHYTEPLRNDELAALTGFSTVYFRKLFCAVYHTSPLEFLKNLRIKKAKEMLRGDFGSVAEIATQLGYGSIYDFSRDFKKHVGVAPSRYEK